MKKTITACLTLWLMLFGLTTNAQTLREINHSPLNHLILIADIHFDPFFSCEISQKPCPFAVKLNNSQESEWPALFSQNNFEKITLPDKDTSYALWQVLLQQIKTQSPQQILILGDFLAHRFHKKYLHYTGDQSQADYQAFVLKTLQMLRDQLREAVSITTIIYPVVGNNDAYAAKPCRSADYCVIINGAFFKDLAILWAPFLSQPQLAAQFKDQFPTGGYYAIHLPDGKNTLIVLNSVMFSKSAQGNALNKASQAQLNWLQAELRQVAVEGGKAIIAFHIPIGIDSYKTVANWFKWPIPFWQSKDSKIFLQLVKQYRPQISAVFTGHLHMDTFMLLSMGSDYLPLPQLVVPAVSPIYGDNPAFKVMAYQADELKIKDLATYFLSLNSDLTHPEWNMEWDMGQLFDPYCPHCNLITQLEKITRDPQNPLTRQYIHFYDASANVQPIDKGYWNPYYWCDIYNVTFESYYACMLGHH